MFNPVSFTTRKVVFEVCSYYQSVYIPCKGSFDVQKRDKRLGPGLVPVVRTLDGAQQALRGASPAPPPERPRELPYRLLYRL